MMTISGVLLDLSGVLYVGDTAIAGAADSLHRLRKKQLAHRFITNTTRRTPAVIRQSLLDLGFDIAAEDIFTASSAALEYLRQYQLKPFTLVHKNLREEFAALHTTDANAVLLGDAAEDFNYRNLNQAFRILMQNEQIPLISMGYNRYFRETDGLSLDLGAFTSALEFASGKQAIIVGKPAADFFLQAVNKLGCDPQQVMMIGDDVESDVNGAIDAGLQACLVRTGKYQAGDEQRMREGAIVMDDVNAAISYLLEQSA